MPAIRGSELVQAIISALEESGASAVSISRADRNPRRFVVQSGENTFELWAYAWTLTHGGGPSRPQDEYRIQLTGLTPPIKMNPYGPTVLIGYEPNSRAFGGFDLTKHSMFSTGSSSVQIPITTINAAQQDGLAFSLKGNDEIVVGIRPDQFLGYALNAASLHKQGDSAKAVDLLIRATSLELINLTELEELSTERRRVVTQISRLSRDADFRRKVTIAYDRTCAVTRMQLRLVDAAHILPVGVEGSSDEVKNGLCLSPTFHRAYDRALIYLDEDLVMRINQEQEEELNRLSLHRGIEDFKRYLDKKIHLPADRRQWPDANKIRAANKFRRISI